MKTLFIILFTLCFVCAKSQIRLLNVGTNVVFEQDDSLLTTATHTFKQFKVDSTGIYDVIALISIKTNANANNHFQLDCTYTNWFGVVQTFYFTPNAITNGDSRFSYQELQLKVGTILQLFLHTTSNTPLLYNTSATIRRNR